MHRCRGWGRTGGGASGVVSSLDGWPASCAAGGFVCVGAALWAGLLTGVNGGVAGGVKGGVMAGFWPGGFALLPFTGYVISRLAGHAWGSVDLCGQGGKAAIEQGACGAHGG